jgi:hypothetical protein
MGKRIFSLIVSLSILGGLLYFSKIDEILKIIQTAKPVFLFIGASITFLSMLVRTYRWQLLLRNLNIKIPLSETFKLLIKSLYISNLTPLKIGDSVRAYMLKKRGHSFTYSLFTVVVERILDIVIMIAFALLGLIFIFKENEGLIYFAYFTIVVYLFVIFILLKLLNNQEVVAYFVGLSKRIFRKIPGLNRIEVNVDETANKIIFAFTNFHDVKRLKTPLLSTIVIWSLESLIVYLSFYSIGIAVTFLSSLVILSIGLLIGSISTLPGGLGSNEVVMVLLFTFLYPLTLSEATTGVLISRFLSYWINMIVGGIFIGLRL